MKKFELPYNFNFDKKWFQYMDENKDLWGYIDMIYLPCFVYNNSNETIYNTREEIKRYPKSKYEYRNHIEKLKRYNIPISILIQKNSSLELIEEYINDYDIHSFVINNDELARELKSKYGDKINLRLSITRMVTREELETKDLSMYDDICLFFTWTRKLDELRKLPKKYKYVVIVNTICLWNCKNSLKHWFNGKTFKPNCFGRSNPCTYRDINMKTSAYVRPEDLSLFDDSIETYKLQGRENYSSAIFDNLKQYVSRVSKHGIKYVNFDENDVEGNYNS